MVFNWEKKKITSLHTEIFPPKIKYTVTSSVLYSSDLQTGTLKHEHVISGVPGAVSPLLMFSFSSFKLRAALLFPSVVLHKTSIHQQSTEKLSIFIYVFTAYFVCSLNGLRYVVWNRDTAPVLPAEG